MVPARHGHPVVQAPDGATALALFAEEKPDLVLLDVEMPGMNGYAVAREMRNRGEESHWVPIIFLSGRVGDDDVVLGIEAGGDDFIAKPVSPIVLRAKLNAMRRLTDMQQRLLEMSRQLQHVNRELKTLSSSDGLTGIANRRAFDRSLELEWQRRLRSGNSPRRVAAIRALATPHANSDVAPHVTMSFGVSACVPSHALTSDRLVEAADAALYEAKSRGRDRVASNPLAVGAGG